AQVEREQDRADQHGGERDEEPHPGRRLVPPCAPVPQQRRERVGAAAEPREQEVAEDVPLPVGWADEVLGGGGHHELPPDTGVARAYSWASVAPSAWRCATRRSARACSSLSGPNWIDWVGQACAHAGCMPDCSRS